MPTSRSGTAWTARWTGRLDANGRHPLTDLVLADYCRRRHETVRRERFVPRDRARRAARRSAPDLRWPGAQRRCDGHDLHASWSMPVMARSSATESTPRPGRRADASRTWRRRTRTRPSPLSTTENGRRVRRWSPRRAQPGARRHPERRAARTTLAVRRRHTCCCASMSVRPAVSWSRRLPVVIVDPARAAGTSHDAWLTVAFTYHGLKALGVPQDSLDSFAPEFRAGDGSPCGRCWATSARAPRHTGSSPSARADVHVAIAVLVAGRGAA